MNEDTFYIGERHQWGGEAPLGFALPELRHHAYVIGKTGSGKTTLLRNLILQLAEAGHGVGLIDPHGDLAEELLDHLSPVRAEQTVYFNPADADFPIGLDLLAQAGADDRHLVASGVVGAFKNLWPDSWGPRMEYILHNAVASLAACPNTSLLGVNRLLTDPAYRRWVINLLTDPFLRDFWEAEYESYDPRFMREAISPIQNKIGQILLSPALRHIVGQVHSGASISQVMDRGQVFIANLSKGRLGHDKANGEFGRAFLPQPFVDLPRHEMLVRLPAGNAGGRYERARSLPPLATHRGRRDRLIRRSRERFGTPRVRIEARLHRWLARRF